MSHQSPLTDVSASAPFAGRHIGPRDAEIARMLDVVGAPSLDALVDAAVPAGIRSVDRLDLPAAAPELSALAA
jgi:glycine dehydrogenase